MSGHYSNFDDPVGVVWRMLHSGNPAARAALGRALVRPVLKPLDRRRSREDRRLLEGAEAAAGARPLLLVTGGARTGTSLTTQVLARRLDVSWFDNWVDLFPNSPLASASRRRSDPAKVELRSFYGNTRRMGGLSDAFSIWNRWLGTDRYDPRLTPEMAVEMRRFFRACEAVFPTPLLNKNNRNLRILPELAEALPQARFVLVTRDPLATAASLLAARRLVHGDVRRPWGVFSTSASSASHELGYVDDVCHQALEAMRATAQAAELLGERATLLDFEKLLQDPHLAAADIGAQHGIGERLEPRAVELRSVTDRPLMAEPERDRARHVLADAAVE